MASFQWSLPRRPLQLAWTCQPNRWSSLMCWSLTVGAADLWTPASFGRCPAGRAGGAWTLRGMSTSCCTAIHSWDSLLPGSWASCTLKSHQKWKVAIGSGGLPCFIWFQLARPIFIPCFIEVWKDSPNHMQPFLCSKKQLEWSKYCRSLISLTCRVHVFQKGRWPVICLYLKMLCLSQMWSLHFEDFKISQHLEISDPVPNERRGERFTWIVLSDRGGRTDQKPTGSEPFCCACVSLIIFALGDVDRFCTHPASCHAFLQEVRLIWSTSTNHPRSLSLTISITACFQSTWQVQDVASQCGRCTECGPAWAGSCRFRGESKTGIRA